MPSASSPGRWAASSSAISATGWAAKLLQFSLLLVGSSTFLMGCLPGFQAIGFAAPALLVLLRFIQGFAVGGSGAGCC